MNDNNNELVYNTIMQMTNLIQNNQGLLVEIPKLNRSMSCHIYSVNTKIELLQQLNSLSFIEHINTNDNDNWMLACRVKDKKVPIFSESWTFGTNKYAGNTMNVIQFMKEGLYELLQNRITKVSLVSFNDDRIVLENDIEQLFEINIQERLNDNEYYLLFRVSFN